MLFSESALKIQNGDLVVHSCFFNCKHYSKYYHGRCSMLFPNKGLISHVIKVLVQIHFPGLLFHHYNGENYFSHHQVS